MSIHPESIFNTIASALVAINRRGQVEIFNQRAETLFGIPAQQAVARQVAEVLPETGRRMLECLQSNRHLGDLVFNEGRTRLNGDITPIRGKGPLVGALGIFKDNVPVAQTQLWNRTEAYRQINRQLDAVFDSSHDGLFITDGKGIILKCNHSSERLIGHMQSDIIGKNVLDLVTQGYIDKSVTHEVLRKKTSLTILQKLRNGKRIIVTGTPVFSETGDIEFVVTNERDITALNRMKRQLREYRELALIQANEYNSDAGIGVSESGIITADLKTRQVFRTAKITAGFDTTILIQGETGVGKGRMARFIHNASQRKDGPFIQINCGAIPDPLIESELFGYRKGAFTGASATGKPGLFQMAHKGTLVLDEIAEIPPTVQVKFLKAIEDREIMAVGDTRSSKIDVRIIASTNSDLKQMVSEGRFREDLFFRLNVVPIRIPPLRERPDDIFPMITAFIEKFNTRFQCKKKLSAAAREQLAAYTYPGNVRELENIIERVMILCSGDEIHPRDLPAYPGQNGLAENCLDPQQGDLTLKEAVARYEERLISAAIQKEGSKAGAARVLGVDPSTIVRKSLKFRSNLPNAISHDK